MAVELYHTDGDDVRVTFDKSYFSDYMRLGKYGDNYCVDKNGRYSHCFGPMPVGPVAERDTRDMRDCYETDEPSVVCHVHPPKTSAVFHNKTFYLRIVL